MKDTCPCVSCRYIRGESDMDGLVEELQMYELEQLEELAELDAPKLHPYVDPEIRRHVELIQALSHVTARLDRLTQAVREMRQCRGKTE